MAKQSTLYGSFKITFDIQESKLPKQARCMDSACLYLEGEGRNYELDSHEGVEEVFISFTFAVYITAPLLKSGQ